MGPDHELPMDEYHRAGVEMTKGNPDVYKALYSRRDDVTLANPFGPPVRGWAAVSERLDLAASHYRDGEPAGVETFSTVAGADLACTVEVERYRARVDEGEKTAIAVRVTTVFRREHGVWKLIHRHGDPITTMRGGDALLEQP